MKYGKRSGFLKGEGKYGIYYQFILGLIILGILYKNMIAWEGVYRISTGKDKT